MRGRAKDDTDQVAYAGVRTAAMDNGLRVQVDAAVAERTAGRPPTAEVGQLSDADQHFSQTFPSSSRDTALAVDERTRRSVRA